MFDRCVWAYELRTGMVVKRPNGGAYVETVEESDDPRFGPRVTARDAAGGLIANYHPAEHVCLLG